MAPIRLPRGSNVVIKTQAEIFAYIRALGLPEVMIEIWDGRGLPPGFLRHFHAPSRFMNGWERLATLDPRYMDYVPLLEPEDDAVYAYNSNEQVYLERYFDDREPTLIGRHFNQMISFIFVNLADSGLEDLAIEASVSLGFPYIEQFALFCRNPGPGNSLETRQRFVELIGGLDSHRESS